jgi:glycine reductase
MAVEAAGVGQSRMNLKLNSFPIDKIEESHKTELDGNLLLLNRKEIEDLLMQDRRLHSVGIDLVHPGESCRIINILDVFEPRIKIMDGGETFPGILGPAKLVGSGTTNALKGMCVMTCGPMEGAEDALLDMAGPCADLSDYARLETVVLSLTPTEGLSRAEFAKAAVQAGVRASLFLGEVTRTKEPQVSRQFELSSFAQATGLRPSLPRIVHVYFLFSHGELRDMLLYGKDTRRLVPTPIHPNEVMDGAIVWSGFSRPTKNTTYDNLNNGIIRTLYEAHGKSIFFAGCIVANHHKLFAEKTLNAELVARLAGDILGADGVIITKDGGGQADTDLMQTCERCEERGIKTTILAMELGGAGGSSAGALVDASPRADAIVSVGNSSEDLRLPGMSRIVGGERLRDYDQDPHEPVTVPTNKVAGIISFYGDNKLGAIEY